VDDGVEDVAEVEVKLADGVADTEGDAEDEPVTEFDGVFETDADSVIVNEGVGVEVEVRVA